MSRPPLALEARYEVAQNGCWLWNGPLNADGYGVATGTSAHRAVWLKSGRQIPDGMELDHICRTRHCVNPDHLEAVTHLENVRRAAHVLLTEADVVAMRLSDEPTEAWAERLGVSYVAAYQARVGVSWASVDVQAVPFPRGAGVRPLDRCQNGHDFTPENTLWMKGGSKRRCRTCRDVRRAEFAKACRAGHDRSVYGGIRANGAYYCNECNRLARKRRHDVAEQAAEDAR